MYCNIYMKWCIGTVCYLDIKMFCKWFIVWVIFTNITLGVSISLDKTHGKGTKDNKEMLHQLTLPVFCCCCLIFCVERGILSSGELQELSTLFFKQISSSSLSLHVSWISSSSNVGWMTAGDDSGVNELSNLFRESFHFPSLRLDFLLLLTGVQVLPGVLVVAGVEVPPFCTTITIYRFL